MQGQLMQVLTWSGEVFDLFEFWHMLKAPLQIKSATMIRTSQFSIIPRVMTYDESSMGTDIGETSHLIIFFGQNQGLLDILFQ